MRIDILTTFTEMFPPVLGASILGRAAQRAYSNSTFAIYGSIPKISTIIRTIIRSAEASAW